jgi:uncharacterized membrane protein
MAYHDHLKKTPYSKILCMLLWVSSLTACPSSDDSTQNDATASPSPIEASESVDPPESSASPSAQSSGNETQSTIPPTAKVIQGIFVYGEGFQTFKACGEKSEVWVIDTPQKALQTTFTQQKLMELEPAYVEIIGTYVPAPKDKDSFAADYEKAIKVTQVKSLSPWMMRKSCFPTDFVATGSRPDWQLKGLNSGDVFFKSNEGEYPIVETLAYKAPVTAGNQFKYSFGFRTPDEDRLELTLTKEPCTHNAKAYAYQAEIKFRGSTYTGCADK